MRSTFLPSLLIGLSAHAAAGDTVVAARTVRAQSVLEQADLAVVPGDVPGAISAIEEAVGLEAQVMLYAGRPVSAGDIGPPAIVERNQIVSLVYSRGGLVITADARALGRAASGDLLRVMNLASKTTLSGVVAPDGTVHVGGMPPQ
ncbi:flagellar basal body P-ring formation chaperone FlgA [Celeribacter indicus]|uniref:Flagella basal body P-ring formation protein FlgA n=1 Tax=Celeribacter indicus TaxID=1208324 RepID=A0A0B5DNN9_9RHOB|nr:flagellar basal body P-ring formation chaperone FlgA [Celeribacter indicus]AJE44814.1 flagellar basal body P-ring biosynthesis protein FlgA [Celeribacter indicus]SDX24416.1 flagella basal body P-ring formation protein FlgA [Celeribacter indicus]